MTPLRASSALSLISSSSKASNTASFLRRRCPPIPGVLGFPRVGRSAAGAVAAAGGENVKELTGVLFEPFEEVQQELALVSSSPDKSLARQKYVDECEAAINEQINVEYNVSYVYHVMFAYFDRDNVALRGMAKFFKESSEEEREHAEKLMKYQNKRGGRVKLQSIVTPLTEFDHEEKGDALYVLYLQMAEGRPYVGPVVNRSFVENAVTRQAVKYMKQSIAGSWPTFSSIPPQDRQIMWRLFEAHYSWPQEETSLIREAWETTLTRRLTQIWSNERKAALGRVKSNSLADTRAHGPAWLPPTYWDGLIIHWLSEGWQKSSKTAASNRATLKEGEIVRHSGGSITFASHEARMEKELRRPPTKTELFLRTHTRKGSTEYVDSRSRVVAEKYDELINAKYGADVDSTQQPYDHDLWLQATGGLTKGKVYGFGGRARSKSISSTSYSSSTSTSQPSTSEYITKAQFKDQFMEMYQQMRAAEQAGTGGSGCRVGIASEEGESDDEGTEDDQ